VQKIRKDAAFGRNIRAMRMAANMTQEELAAKMQLEGCDMSRSILAHIETGTYNVRVSELSSLKKIFKTDYNAFFEGVD